MSINTLVDVPRKQAAQIHPAQIYPTTQLEQNNVYQYYRAFLSTVINMNSPQLQMKKFICNNLFNSGLNGVHEKFIHFGRSVADLSIGELEYPWMAADADKHNEVSVMNFDRLAAGETNPIVAERMWMISHFVHSFPTAPRIYFYKGSESTVVSVTLVDELNKIKFNYMPTEFTV